MNDLTIPRPVQGDAPERLANWRREKGYTQTEAAARLGCSQPTLSEIEGGLTWPNEEVRKAIARKAGIPVSAWGQRPPRRRRAPSVAPGATPAPAEQP